MGGTESLAMAAVADVLGMFLWPLFEDMEEILSALSTLCPPYRQVPHLYSQPRTENILGKSYIVADRYH